ncbi:unnamed protein product [Coffea canephora]|uniref:Transmembrane 9 superfamily member n=1 Tax=Coffea canephora TaxID=49390 RepID=A0A068UAZ1_COFCA|nr:unnamed protein product [Coffea canephora]
MISAIWFYLVELYHIFDCVWGFRVYNPHGILCIVIVLVIIATTLLSIGLTYFQVAVKDHKWWLLVIIATTLLSIGLTYFQVAVKDHKWWRRSVYGSLVSLYLALFYLTFNLCTENSDLVKHTILYGHKCFFGCMAYIYDGIFLMLGTVGFRASLLFIWCIYGSIKYD